MTFADIPPPEKIEPRDACTYTSWGLGLLALAFAVRLLLRARRARGA